MDHQSLPPVDLFIAAEPREAVGAFLGKLQAKTAAVMVPAYMEQQEPQPKGDSSLRVQDVAHALRLAVSGIPISLLRLPLGWSGDMWDWESPLDYLGYDGGGGIGSGPGMSIGAALALMGSGRLPIAILGDGDFMMGVSAFWTSANANIPLLTVVCNNHSFFNDELHQERVAKDRSRPVENRGIGQRMETPEIDLAFMARGQGLVGIGPINTWEELHVALTEGIKAVNGGAAVVIDVHVAPGYSPSMAKQMTRDPAGASDKP